MQVAEKNWVYRQMPTQPLLNVVDSPMGEMNDKATQVECVSEKEDNENDSHKIRHKFFKWPRQKELATNASSSEKVGSIHFATSFDTFDIMVVQLSWCSC